MAIESNKKYSVSRNYSDFIEVTLEEFIAAEIESGFRSYSNTSPSPATGGFLKDDLKGKRTEGNISSVFSENLRTGECPYVDHPHTRGYCRYEMCEEKS